MWYDVLFLGGYFSTCMHSLCFLQDAYFPIGLLWLLPVTLVASFRCLVIFVCLFTWGALVHGPHTGYGGSMLAGGAGCWWAWIYYDGAGPFHWGTSDTSFSLFFLGWPDSSEKTCAVFCLEGKDLSLHHHFEGRVENRSRVSNCGWNLPIILLLLVWSLWHPPLRPPSPPGQRLSI